MRTSFVPDSMRILLKMMAWGMVLLLLLRITFLVFHHSSFERLAFSDWLVGFFYDLMTVCILYLPYSGLAVLPLPIQQNKLFLGFSWFYFMCANTALLIANLLDLEYFKFTGKRSTYDFLSMPSMSFTDWELFWTFFQFFWWIFLLFIGFLWLCHWFFNKYIMADLKNWKFGLWKQLTALIVTLPLIVIVGRGGLQLRPVGILEASKFTDPANTSFVLNTTFTFIKSYGDKGLEPKEYFPEDSCLTLFNPIQKSTPQDILPEKTNVVMLILESFGSEWFQPSNDRLTTSYTPFLDSIANQSWFFPNAYANGKKSIEAVPAIIASIPSLMNNPYITSNYAENKIQSLPSILKQFGYSSAFYHGASNGSMRFDSFASTAGYDQYFGRTEYGNEDHYDNSWGILDEYFNTWTAKKISDLKAPFFATLFNISPHHPHFVPENRRAQMKKGPFPICAALNYADFSLQKFFEVAKTQDWYKHTIFVFVPDHTPSPSTSLYHSKAETYKIPFFIYDPSGKVKPQRDPRIFQQTDILPTLLDLLNISTPYYGFGHSAFSKDKRFAVTYLEGVYYYFCDSYMISFSSDQIQSVSNLKWGRQMTASEIKQNKSEIEPMVLHLKAIIQTYNQDLMNNKTIVP